MRNVRARNYFSRYSCPPKLVLPRMPTNPMIASPMEFQSGQNCVTEINCVLCCKSQQDCAMVCKMQRRHAQNAEMCSNAEIPCSKCRDVVLKFNAEIPCSKCEDLVLKMQGCRAQKCGDLVLKIQRCRAQNAETSCSKSRDAVLKMRRRRAQMLRRRAQNAGELKRKTLRRIIPAGRIYLQHVSYTILFSSHY